MIGEPNGQHAVHAGQSKNNSNIRSIMAVMALMRNIFAPRKTSKNCGAKAGHGNMLLVATIKPWGLPWRCEECCIEIYTCWGETSCAHQMGTQPDWPNGSQEGRRKFTVALRSPGFSHGCWLMGTCCQPAVQSLPCRVFLPWSWPSICISCIFRALPQRCSDLFAVTAASIAHARKELPQRVESDPFDVAILRGGATRHLAQHVAHSRDGWYHRESS